MQERDCLTVEMADAASSRAAGAIQLADPRRFLRMSTPWWMRSWRYRDPVGVRINGVMLLLVGGTLLGSMALLWLT